MHEKLKHLKCFKHIIYTAAVVPLVLSLCGCFSAPRIDSDTSATPMPTEMAAVLDEDAPVIEFTAKTSNEDGLPEYYLFDDNPEHLNSKYLADGENPSSIAHFEDLTPGVYTVFSYHHRGYSVDLNADLYYDVVFSSSGGGEFEIESIGLDHDWNWTQAWADYTGEPVIMPEYYRTYSCTCGKCGTDEASDPDCPGLITGEQRDPSLENYDKLGKTCGLDAGNAVYLSDYMSRIESEGVNKFRYGGYDEPMWLMMKFKVTSGTVTFDTMAYTDKAAAKANFKTLLKGAFDNESQYKGIADNAPITTAEFSLKIDDDTEDGALPVTVKNSRVPSGLTIEDGIFATYVNTWREAQPIAAESDIMQIRYEDDTKLGLYGKSSGGDNIWRFDPTHTKHYGGYSEEDEEILSGYGIPVGDDFSPNISILDIDYPSGLEISSDEFYAYNACNLGNFGVTTEYVIHTENSGSESRTLSFSIKSIAGQVYRYSQVDLKSGKTVTDDSGAYIMKKFDDDPPEDPTSTSEPKARLKPSEIGDVITFELESGGEYDINISVTTLTGCVAPMHNQFSVGR